MNNDEKLMQEFMDSLKEEKKENVTPYKASSNMNLQLGNPNFNMNNSMAVNIKDANVTEPKVDNFVNKPANNLTNIITTTNNVVEEPIIATNVTPIVNKPMNYNKKNVKIYEQGNNPPQNDNKNVTSDLKFVVLLALIFLIVVLFLIPSLSDKLSNFFANR